MATDNAYDRRGDNAPFTRLSNGQMNSNNVNLLDQYWQISYQKIARSNYFLENVDQTPVDPAVIERMKAEARFIRAVQYFYLSQHFGSVPLVTSTQSLEEANTLRKTPKVRSCSLSSMNSLLSSMRFPRHPLCLPVNLAELPNRLF